MIRKVATTPRGEQIRCQIFNQMYMQCKVKRQLFAFQGLNLKETCKGIFLSKRPSSFSDQHPVSVMHVTGIKKLIKEKQFWENANPSHLSNSSRYATKQTTLNFFGLVLFVS